MKLKIAFLLLILVTAAPAAACDLRNISFGSSIDQTVSSFSLDVMETTTEDEFILSEMGKVVCEDLPDESMMEFTFIDNVFVKIKISNPNTAAALLAHAKTIFGENDDADRKKSNTGKTSIALWSGDATKTILYSTHTSERDGEFESLDITSKMHESLFEKIAEQKGKALDEYLQANGLGKYSKGYIQDRMNSTSSDSNTTGEYDPDALKKLKDQYDKSQESWKENNDANRLGR